MRSKYFLVTIIIKFIIEITFVDVIILDILFIHKVIQIRWTHSITNDVRALTCKNLFNLEQHLNCFRINKATNPLNE